MKLPIIAVILAAILATSPAAGAAPSGQQELPLDTEAAIEWCDSHPLDRIEGVWLYPDDQVTVLIHKTEGEDYQYAVSVVESEDMALMPGDRIGTIATTAQPDRFSMTLFTGKAKGKLSRPRKCALALTADDCGLTVSSKTRNWRINPLGILPYFWKVARVSVSDPMKSLPVGMTRLYPSYDGNGSSRFHIRYL